MSMKKIFVREAPFDLNPAENIDIKTAKIVGELLHSFANAVESGYIDIKDMSKATSIEFEVEQSKLNYKIVMWVYARK